MNRSLILCAFVLILLPGCKSPLTYQVQPPLSSAPTNQTGVYDEELGAFVIHDDDQSFGVSLGHNVACDEELVVEGTAPAVSNLADDSHAYGFKELYFGFNKHRIDDLGPDQRPVLQENIALVKSLLHKGYRISIEGHACNSAGSTEYNTMLSELRAREVRDYLRSHGASRGMITVVGYGATQLRVPTGDRREQGPNRRVEIYAYKEEKQ